MRVFAGLVQEWEAAPHGQRGALLAARLPLLGISLGTFHRERERRFGETGRQTPKTKGVPKRPEYLEAVRAIIKEKFHPKKGVRPLTTADAQAEAAAKGCALALAIPEGTVNRVARELRLHPRVQRREARFEASRPNELHQMDASRSEYFQCHRHRGGEWVLKLSPTIFKNRDYRELRERVWIWGLVDNFSGFRVLRYCVAKGESAADGISFLQWAWSRVPEHAPFRGLPDTLYLDQGPLNKTKAFQRFCEEVAGVRLLAHEAGRPQATGKVESGWKTLWRRFEARFFRGPGLRAAGVLALRAEPGARLAPQGAERHRAPPAQAPEQGGGLADHPGGGGYRARSLGPYLPPGAADAGRRGVLRFPGRRLAGAGYALPRRRAGRDLSGGARRGGAGGRSPGREEIRRGAFRGAAGRGISPGGADAAGEAAARGHRPEAYATRHLRAGRGEQRHPPGAPGGDQGEQF